MVDHVLSTPKSSQPTPRSIGKNAAGDQRGWIEMDYGEQAVRAEALELLEQRKYRDALDLRIP